MIGEQTAPLEQLAGDLHQEVLVRAGNINNPQMREDAFTEYLLEILSEHNASDGAEVCYHASGARGRNPAAKVNAWTLSDDGATLDLFITLYNGTGEVVAVPRSVVAEQFKLLRGFLRRAREGFHTQLEESHESFQAARRIYESSETLTTVRLFLLTDGVVKSPDIDQEQLRGLEINYVLWDLEKLGRLRVGDREVIELDFLNNYEGAIPCIQVGDFTGDYRTFLTFFSGQLLARIYGEHGQRLLERNVRAFLQAKGKINQEMQQTLIHEPHRFLAYNNGLCCTAAEVDLQMGRNGQAWLERVSDFQIVNGGQTTASIFHALKKAKADISQVFVQAKLTVVNDTGTSAEIVPLISKYANSQNKINGADLAATGKFHRELEGLSRTVWAPAVSGMDRGTHWYYERARGSYLDDKARQGTPARQREWLENNPREQKFTKTDLAKYEQTWLCMPHVVCMGGEKNFIAFADRLEDEGEPAVDLTLFRHSVSKAILFRTSEKLFGTLDLEGYRANTVAYALAWLAERSEHRIDLDWIWQNQRVPPGTQDAIATACQSAHKHLNGTSGNVGEWSKKADCWQRFRALEIPLPAVWEQEWADSPFISTVAEGDDLAEEWEKLRSQFYDDCRTLGELEVLTGRHWIARHRQDEVCVHAARNWEQLRGSGGRRYKNLRAFVELFSAAARLKNNS